MAVAAVATLVGFVIAACSGSGGTTSSGAFETVLTDERLVTVAGSRCAVEGHATNVGNLRARVQLTYEARNAAGGTIGTASASFEVPPFSNFDFRTDAFDSAPTCDSISTFDRTRTSVTRA